jgi:hypothetical protein
MRWDCSIYRVIVSSRRGSETQGDIGGSTKKKKKTSNADAKEFYEKGMI